MIGALVLIVASGFVIIDRAIADDATTTAPASEQNTAVDVSDLEAQIREKQQQIEDLNQQQALYQKTIDEKQQEALNLKNQITILDTQIEQTDTTIRKMNLEVEKLGLEIDALNEQIQEKDLQLRQQKERLGEFVRMLNRYGRKTALEISLLNNTFSQFYNQLKYLQTVEQEAKRGLDRVQQLKKEFEEKQDAVEKKKAEAEQKRQDLAVEKKSMESEQGYRENLLTETQDSEQRYNDLLAKAKQEQDSANTDIQTLEAQIRQRLDQKSELPESPSAFIWPVTSRRITAYFHDPSYIFRRIFEHPAIDVATPQGTPLRAAASGYVARARNAGMGYSYIMLVHGGGISTVYGHVSQISVVENDFVVQGQVIGYSGGTPGTAGAGRLTTGAHLHLEVRYKGIPVDPLGYLPK